MDDSYETIFLAFACLLLLLFLLLLFFCCFFFYERLSGQNTCRNLSNPVTEHNRTGMEGLTGSSDTKKTVKKPTHTGILFEEVRGSNISSSLSIKYREKQKR